ncbi:MAG: hypothetical protein N2482_00350 [Patescibacteria group bacterium]|nr:hypothetical protein [Patescibacteria group bacterium]
MRLLNFFSKNKNEIYLAIFLKEEEGRLIVLKSNNQKMIILELRKFFYSNGWENLPEDIDEILFQIESQTKTKIKKTIFFLFSHLVEIGGHKIKEPYLTKIKEIIKGLELIPLGFVDCQEAISNQLAKEEGVGLTAILLEIDKTNLTALIYKGGQLKGVKTVSRTNDFLEDLILLLSDFKKEMILPSRIILYNSNDLDDKMNRILTYRWQENIFVQLPKVEILPEKKVIQELINVFENQINFQEEGIISERVEKKEEVMGFVIGGDIKEEEIENKKTKKESLFKKKTINFLNFFSHFSLPKISWSKKSYLILGGILIISALFLNEFFFHKASLTIFIPTQTIKKELMIKNLAIKTKETKIELKRQKETTGKKLIGERAKGEVIIYNFDKEKIFEKGTVLETEGIKFTIEEEVKVASASLTSDGSAKLPGKAKVKVLAKEIGKQGNISKGKTFKFLDLDPETYFAKNEISFSDGLEKEVRTVDKKDIETLKEAVFEEAKKGKSVIKLAKNERLIESLTELKFDELKFSKEIGEEGSVIDLSAIISTIYYFYNNDELINLIYPFLNKEISKDFLLKKEKISYQIKDVLKEDGKIYLSLLTEGRGIKKINEEEIYYYLLGKEEKDWQNFLKTKAFVAGYKLNNNNNQIPIPFLKNRLPFFKKNLELKIAEFK